MPTPTEQSLAALAAFEGDGPPMPPLPPPLPPPQGPKDASNVARHATTVVASGAAPMKMIAAGDATLKGESNSTSGRAAIETHPSDRTAIEISIPKHAQTTKDISVAAAAATIIQTPPNNSRDDDKEDWWGITKSSAAQVIQQNSIDARRAALRDTDYSVEEESTAANNANSWGQKSAATKKKNPTTKEVRVTASLARQRLVGSSESTDTAKNNATSSSTKVGASKKRVSVKAGMSVGTPAEGERVPGTVTTTLYNSKCVLLINKESLLYSEMHA